MNDKTIWQMFWAMIIIMIIMMVVIMNQENRIEKLKQQIELKEK